MKRQESTKEKTPFSIYFLVLMVILASKTVFFGIIHMRITIIFTILFFLLYCVYMTKKGKLKIKNSTLIYFFIFTMLQIVLATLHFEDFFDDINSYMGNIILFLEIMIIGLFVVNVIEKKDFIKSYVHIIMIISLISLVFFVWSNTNKSAFTSICNIYDNQNLKYIALPIYTYGWQVIADNGYVYNYIFGRNAGPFWEPGAFQGFLIIAIFFVLNYKKLFKHKTIIMSILLITLLTTQSTTGYIILLISLIAFVGDYVECLFGKSKKLKANKHTYILALIISFIFIIFITYIIISSGNISNKFDDNNGSYISRKGDIENSLNVLLNNSIIGIGFGNNTSNIIANSATTILAIATYYGIPFTIYYLYRFMSGCECMYECHNFRKKIILMICFTCLLMSETLYLLPVYAIFLFSNNRWKLNT